MYASWITERLRSAAIIGAAAEKLTLSIAHENITEAAIGTTCAKHCLLLAVWQSYSALGRQLHMPIIAMQYLTFS